MASVISPFGAWPSPLSAADVAAGGVALSWPQLVGDEVWWSEGRPAEGGRVAVLRRRVDGVVEDVLPAPWNARTRVHEYGGRSFVVAAGRLVFANFADQRLWLMPPGGDPVPLTPEPEEACGARYADLLVTGEEVWCVREVHREGVVRRALVAVPLDGSGRVRELVAGSDFLAHPRLSPDGTQLAWIAWDHPRMPWDGTELRVAPVQPGGVVGEPRRLAGGADESVLQPEWLDDTALIAMSDRSEWWNPVRVSVDGSVEPVVTREEEFAGPLWQLGMSWYQIAAGGRLVVTHGATVGVLYPGGELCDLDLPWTAWSPMLHTDGQRVVTVAGSPTSPTCVVIVDADGGYDVVRRSAELPVDSAWLPIPSRETYPSADGRVVHAVVYPPTSPQVQPPAGERPPFVVFLHGGPTSAAATALDLQKVYFTSRGIGVIDVDYGGSTGYGRRYRQALLGEWGIVDVEDTIAAGRGLADAGRADPARLVIRGGSAGGWTVLAALTTSRAFAAGTSYFGVSDPLRLAQLTHDFESRYLDGLVGPLPDALAVYEQRSPLANIDDLASPVLLLQGADDPVVPPEQAEMFRDALAGKQIPHAYVLFEGEQHGFRKAENMVAALEAEISFYGQILGFDPPGIARLPLSR